MTGVVTGTVVGAVDGATVTVPGTVVGALVGATVEVDTVVVAAVDVDVVDVAALVIDEEVVVDVVDVAVADVASVDVAVVDGAVVGVAALDVVAVVMGDDVVALVVGFAFVATPRVATDPAVELNEATVMTGTSPLDRGAVPPSDSEDSGPAVVVTASLFAASRPTRATVDPPTRAFATVPKRTSPPATAAMTILGVQATIADFRGLSFGRTELAAPRALTFDCGNGGRGEYGRRGAEFSEARFRGRSSIKRNSFLPKLRAHPTVLLRIAVHHPPLEGPNGPLLFTQRLPGDAG